MNIGRVVAETADAFAERPAFFVGEEEVSYREFGERVAALAAGFRSLGVSPGDRVAVYTDNRPQLLECYYAAWQAGACVVPLNARFVADEVAYHVGDSRARTIVFAGEHRDAVAGPGGGRLPSVDNRVCIGEPGEGQISYEDLVLEHRGAERRIEHVPDDAPAWLFYTSGTTGRPKGAVLTHGNLSFVAVGWCADVMHIEPEDIGMHAAPLSHGAGFHALALTAKGAAQAILPAPRFDARTFCETVERRRVTNTAMVPTQVRRLISFEGLEDYDLSSLRYFAYYGSPMYVADLKEALRKMGPIFVQIYGQGETPMTATYLRREEHVPDRPEGLTGRLASCGRARTGVEVAILDDKDAEVPTGGTGEICVRGPSVFEGYWERPEETADTLKNGWLHTGDLGRADERGYFYVLDRKKDMVISGGSNVYPREIEEVLLEHPAVSEVCVFGVPDPDWVEAVKAVVVPMPGTEPTEGEIFAFCRKKMAAYKRPKSVDFVEELPKSSIGKILKRELRDRYRQTAAT